MKGMNGGRRGQQPPQLLNCTKARSEGKMKVKGRRIDDDDAEERIDFYWNGFDADTELLEMMKKKKKN